MYNNTQMPKTDGQIQGDRTVPATPAKSTTPVTPVKPVEEPGIEESVPTEAAPAGEPEEEESFEDSDADADNA